jgi:hypothetical protein
LRSVSSGSWPLGLTIFLWVDMAVSLCRCRDGCVWSVGQQQQAPSSCVLHACILPLLVAPWPSQS